MARDAWLWPFHINDPWNRPVGDGATLAAITNSGWSLMQNVYGRTGPYLGLAVSSDPTRKVWKDNGVQKNTLQVGDSTTTGSWGGDSPLTVVSADKLTLGQFYAASRYSAYQAATGGSITGAVAKDLVMRNAGAWNGEKGVSTQGFGWDSLDTGSWNFQGRASRSLFLGGAIRPGEMAVSYGVKHAIAFNTDQRSLAKNSPLGGTSSSFWVWPATSGDGFNNMSATGNVWYGSLLVLDPSLDLTGSIPTALNLETTQGLEVARAVQDYGLYVVDTTAQTGCVIGLSTVTPGGSVVNADLGGWNSALLAAWARDVIRIVQSSSLKVVTNNHDDGAAPAGGIPGGSSGTLRAALAASFDDPAIPAAPTTFALGSPTTNSLTATWDASGVTGETGFDIQHRTVPGSYPGSPQITTIAADATSHVISGLTADDYAAQGRSKNASGESAWSNEATGTVPVPPTVPSAASGAAGTAVNYRTIDWSWTDNSDNETGFKVYVQKTAPGGPPGTFDLITTTAANAITYRQTDATPGSGTNTYVLRVYATNATGDSATYSESAPVVTPNPPDTGGGSPTGQDVAVYPAASVFPDAGSKVFPQAADVKFPS